MKLDVERVMRNPDYLLSLSPLSSREEVLTPPLPRGSYYVGLAILTNKQTLYR